MPQKTGNDSRPVDEYRMLWRLEIGAGFGVVFIVLYSLHVLRFFRWGVADLGSAVRIASVGIVVAGAAMFIGFLLGFVFCIPRTAKPENEKITTLDDDGIETNTNLIDISDWLTKILVGVGLVEFGKIPPKLWALAEFIGPGLRHCDSQDCVASARAFAVAIVIFFSGVGS